MKVLYICKADNHMVLSADYWEIELLGFDTVKNKAILDSFIDNVLKEIEAMVRRYLSPTLDYGIKWMNDVNKMRFLYEIKPYDERIDELKDTARQSIVLSIVEGLIEALYTKRDH